MLVTLNFQDNQGDGILETGEWRRALVSFSDQFVARTTVLKTTFSVSDNTFENCSSRSISKGDLPLSTVAYLQKPPSDKCKY